MKDSSTRAIILERYHDSSNQTFKKRKQRRLTFCYSQQHSDSGWWRACGRRLSHHMECHFTRRTRGGATCHHQPMNQRSGYTGSTSHFSDCIYRMQSGNARLSHRVGNRGSGTLPKYVRHARNLTWRLVNIRQIRPHSARKEQGI